MHGDHCPMSLRLWIKDNQSWLAIVVAVAGVVVALLALWPAFYSAFKESPPTQRVEGNTGVVIGSGAQTGDVHVSQPQSNAEQ